MSKKTIRQLAVLSVLVGFLSACTNHYTATKASAVQYEMSDALPADSSIIKYYLPYKAKMEAEMHRIIGQADVALTGGKQPETLLGNFFSAAVLDQGLKLDPSIQFTFATKGGLRNALPKGNITIGNVFELMPFENELVLLKLSGSDTQKLMDFIAQSSGQPEVGVTMKIKSGKPHEVSIAGKPFDINKNYSVLTYDYLANSGGDLAFLGNALETKVLGLKLRDALIQYIEQETKKGNKITAKLDGRITSDENE